MGEVVEAIYGPPAPNWRMVRLKNLVEEGIAELQTGPFGTMLHASSYRTKGTPVIAVQHIGDNSLRQGEYPLVDDDMTARLSRYKVREKDILFGRKGAVDRRALIRAHESGWLQGSDCIRLRFTDAIDARYISYVLGTSAYKQWATRHAQGATMPSLNQEILGLIPLPLPPLPEQKRIAHILGTLDDKIELNRHMNVTLEAMAQALFKSWFVDFDPVRAKAEGRKPKGMDAETAALFPSEFQDSEIGPIPKGWSAVTLPEAIDVNPRRKLTLGTVAPYLDMKNVPTRGHCAEDVTNREFKSGTKFQNGDTLLARITPCLENGKTAYVDFLNNSQVGWGSTEFIVFAPKPPLPSQFAYFLARSDELRSHAIQNMTGTSGRQRVPSECFTKFILSMPPLTVARRFGELTAPLMAKIKAAAQESGTLAIMRNTMLPKLLIANGVTR